MLKTTPLLQLHQSYGAKLVDFGGWHMPVNYGSQIEEHHAVRNDAGMFDVSHMTVVDVSGADAKPYLRKLLANDVAKLDKNGQALYSGMLNEQGGVIDDLIVYLMDFGYRLVVNCATREKDLAWMQAQSQGFELQIQERSELAMIAVQGPKARAAVEALVRAQAGEAAAQALGELPGFAGCEVPMADNTWFVARTGYTGEDGYEIILPNSAAEACFAALYEAGVKPCGLGARDTLRLEAGMNLYGHEMDESVSPLVANMAWTVAWGKDESRDFIGRSALVLQKDTGVREKLVGLVLQGRGVMREGYEVSVPGVERSGVVTSGSFSPTLACSIALARVPVEIGEQAVVIIRGKEHSVDVVRPCFVRFGEAV